MASLDRQQVHDEVKNALAHINDVTVLASNPLAIAMLPYTTIVESSAHGLQLRALLIGLIESLKPSADVSENAPEWRHYLVLHDRYVLHRPLWEIEHKLTIGERQVRREHNRGVAILAEMVQSRLTVAGTFTTEPAATPEEAIQRLTPVARVFDLAQLLEEVVAFLAMAGRVQENQAHFHVMPDELTVCTDRGILRQLLTRLLLSLIPQSAGSPLNIDAMTVNDGVVMLSVATTQINPADEGLMLCRLLARTLGTDLSFTGTNSISFNLPPGSRLRQVLVIDDELAAIELFQSYVIGLEYQVIGEANAEEALHRALQVQPDVIILDVMMPAIDGWELLQRLRHTAQLLAVPVIVCSVLEEAGLAASLGAAGFLKKPILRTHLIKMLHEVIK
jgi:CheY-like chemotaxis protein